VALIKNPRFLKETEDFGGLEIMEFFELEPEQLARLAQGELLQAVAQKWLLRA
jgi:hypothetical protein